MVPGYTKCLLFFLYHIPLNWTGDVNLEVLPIVVDVLQQLTGLGEMGGVQLMPVNCTLAFQELHILKFLAVKKNVDFNRLVVNMRRFSLSKEIV